MCLAARRITSNDRPATTGISTTRDAIRAQTLAEVDARSVDPGGRFVPRPAF